MSCDVYYWPFAAVPLFLELMNGYDNMLFTNKLWRSGEFSILSVVKWHGNVAGGYLMHCNFAMHGFRGKYPMLMTAMNSVMSANR